MSAMDFIRVAAPYVGAAIDGPMGGLALKYAAERLRVPEATHESVANAIQDATPVQLADLETDLRRHMANLQVEFDRIATSVTVEARAAVEAKQVDYTPRVLAGIVLVSWVATNFFMFTNELSPAAKDIVLRGLGTIDAAVGLVLGYYFGSSASSAIKSEMLSRSKNG